MTEFYNIDCKEADKEDPKAWVAERSGSKITDISFYDDLSSAIIVGIVSKKEWCKGAPAESNRHKGGHEFVV